MIPCAQNIHHVQYRHAFITAAARKGWFRSQAATQSSRAGKPCEERGSFVPKQRYEQHQWRSILLSVLWLQRNHTAVGRTKSRLPVQMYNGTGENQCKSGKSRRSHKCRSVLVPSFFSSASRNGTALQKGRIDPLPLPWDGWRDGGTRWVGSLVVINRGGRGHEGRSWIDTNNKKVERRRLSPSVSLCSRFLTLSPFLCLF